MLGCTGKNKAKTAVSVAVAAKPEVEIWRRPKKWTIWPWFPIHSFRHFFARTYRFGTIQNVTDRRQTDRRQSVPKARPIVRSAKNAVAKHWPAVASHDFSATMKHGCVLVCLIRSVSRSGDDLSPSCCTCCLWPWLGHHIWRRCDTLCTSGFVDNAMFSHVGHSQVARA